MADIALFAVEAEEKINEELYDEAIELCREGLKEYPYYPLGYFLQALAYLKKHDKEDALYSLESGLNLFPANNLLLQAKENLLRFGDFYSKEIHIEEPVHDNGEGKGFLRKLYSLSAKDEATVRSDDVSIIPGMMMHKLTQSERQAKAEEAPIEEAAAPSKVDLSLLAAELMKYSVEKKKEAPKQAAVSDTLASIYEKQGAYEEAIKAYESLMAQKPDKKDFYLDKINSLKRKV